MQDLADLTPDTFSMPHEFADLPHALLRRTDGGRAGEQMVSVELVFDQTHAGWVALEFLAFWARERSGGGRDTQMRPLALAPTQYGTQLGRTLRFTIEEFVSTPSDALEVIGEMADALAGSVRQYAGAIEKPTRLSADTAEELRELAEANDAQAMVDLAHLLRPDDEGDDGPEGGSELPADADESLSWFERAANLGHPEGAVQAGLAYRHGYGVPADEAKAAGLFRAAAEEGFPLGMALYGQALQQGAGVTADPAEAARWYERGGEAGEPACYAQLGDCYETGTGVPQDLAQARHYYELALAEGFDEVQEALARLPGGE